MPVVIAEDRPRVEVTLSGGSHATISPIVPDDVNLVREGLEHLSVESRFSRFGQGIAHLSPAELRYLTDVDQRSHVAWGALVDGEVAGVGRYITTESGCSEVALTVVDEYQHRGLGTLLLRVLAATARADGVEEFCFEVVPGNSVVKHLVDGLELHPDASGSLLEGRLRVADLPAHPQENEMMSVLEAFRGHSPWRPEA